MKNISLLFKKKKRKNKTKLLYNVVLFCYGGKNHHSNNNNNKDNNKKNSMQKCGYNWSVKGSRKNSTQLKSNRHTGCIDSIYMQAGWHGNILAMRRTYNSNAFLHSNCFHMNKNLSVYSHSHSHSHSHSYSLFNVLLNTKIQNSFKRIDCEV